MTASARPPAAPSPASSVATVSNLLPWLETPWRQLWNSHRQGRLGHAWLLAGRAGLGKRAFADRFARALLCVAPGPEGVPCDTCDECRLALGGNHPDCAHVGPDPDSESQEIKIDTIRALTSREALTPHRAARKVIQILPAEAMNRAAANSLLKTLEEPAPSTLLLLIAEQPSRLPATVRSRCQTLMLMPPPAALALPWLAARLGPRAALAPLLLRLAQGAPLRALELAEPDLLAAREQRWRDFNAVALGQRDPLAVAAAWQSSEPGLVLEAATGWVCDLLRLGVDPDADCVGDPDRRAELTRLAGHVGQRAAHRYLQELLRARRLLAAPINKMLLFESLLIRWALLARTPDERN